MILITDGGSTKCDWIAIDKNGNQAVDKIRTKGLNPAIVAEKKLKKTIKGSDELMAIANDVTHVYFYGAGCGTEKPAGLCPVCCRFRCRCRNHHCTQDKPSGAYYSTDR